ncbi:hypothetical protein JOD82_001865 [Paenibacillus sp. 1182]|uniref:hypothetical protein n=1 Tax=Paenibacillus sp. 1182 TaxID=2806565 RepID=UPI001AE67394|nr:hypothetical protein [Paenibacillus sp. 1182]MBP1308845.1 hypothetical protein [Paenibacillus sp. 1182]
MEQLTMKFNTMEYVFLQRALLKREPSIFVKFNELLMDLFQRVSEEDALYDRDDLFVLFNSLLVMDRNELFDFYRRITKDNQSNEKLEGVTSSLLCRLWIEVRDRRKEEALWSMSFRVLLDAWNIPYKVDMNRIGVPENIENEEDE